MHPKKPITAVIFMPRRKKLSISPEKLLSRHKYFVVFLISNKPLYNPKHKSKTEMNTNVVVIKANKK